MKTTIKTIVIAIMLLVGLEVKSQVTLIRPSKYLIQLYDMLETRDGCLIANCPIFHPETFDDIGQYIYKITLDGEIIDSVYIANEDAHRFLFERNPLDEHGNIMVTWVQDKENDSIMLKMDFFDDNLVFTDQKLVPLHDQKIVNSYYLDKYNDIIIHCKDWTSNKRYLARVGLDGIVKDWVMYKEDVPHNNYQYHCVGMYNQNPLEYCVWFGEDIYKIHKVVVDSTFNLICDKKLDAKYQAGWLEQIEYDDEEHYLLSSQFLDIPSLDKYVHLSKMTKDDEPVQQVLYNSANDYDISRPIMVKRANEGGWYYSYIYNNKDIWVVKLDNELNVEWQRRYLDDPDRIFRWGSSLIPLDEGGLAIAGWDSNTSPDYLRFFVVILTGDNLSTPEIETYVRPYGIYPNPATDHLQLTISPDTKIVKAELYDTNGRLVLAQTNSLNEIIVTHLSSGSYIMKLYTDSGKTYSEKVIKE